MIDSPRGSACFDETLVVALRFRSPPETHVPTRIRVAAEPDAATVLRYTARTPANVSADPITHGSYIRHYSAVWYDTAALREHRSRSRRDTSASGHPADATLNLRLHALDRFVKPRTLAGSEKKEESAGDGNAVNRGWGRSTGTKELYRGKFQFLAAVKGKIIYGRTTVFPTRGNRGI
ncbi:hypothetical protein WN48_07878 [Eufriesea mexicana]|uniref:Uncharacterized protein n=1 Tax=Eufriesea mexicana TaxID=516756 RepID=A0A310SNR2_9HYME|nr:hypothetical protein WN48_07878 [Eufriesea mexicana]